MTDLIDRQAAIKIAESYGLSNGTVLGRHCGVADSIAEAISSLPTINPEDLRLKGKWISLEPEIGLFGCSRCEHIILRAKCNYCPECGAKMEG